MSFGSAAHYLHGARLARGNGALLHFKFIADFRNRVNEEIVRRAYFRGGEEYARYYARFGAGAAIDFGCDASVRYGGASQLAELGLVRAPQDMTEGTPPAHARPPCGSLKPSLAIQRHGVRGVFLEPVAHEADQHAEAPEHVGDAAHSIVGRDHEHRQHEDAAADPCEPDERTPDQQAPLGRECAR